MSKNGKRGSYRTTRKNVMAAFDKLPPSVRSCLANAHFGYVPQPILTRLKQGFSERVIETLIYHWDKDTHERDAKRGLVAPLAPDGGRR